MSAMRLTMLGGSVAGDNPGQGSSGIFAESGSTRVVLDLGPDTFPKLRRHVDFRTMDAVSLSHLHLPYPGRACYPQRTRIQPGFTRADYRNGFRQAV